MAENLDDFKMEDAEMNSAAGGTGDDFEAFCRICRAFKAKSGSDGSKHKWNCANQWGTGCEWNESC